MNISLINLAYLVASVLFILGLTGLGHPRTAVRGNLIGAVGMLIAVVATLVSHCEERLQQAVESGRLTADKAAAKLAEITTRITERITTSPPQSTV